MDNDTIMILLGFVVTLASVLAPIIKLNVTLTKLDMSIQALSTTIENNTKQIEIHEHRLNEYDIKFAKLESRRDK